MAQPDFIVAGPPEAGGARLSRALTESPVRAGRALPSPWSSEDSCAPGRRPVGGLRGQFAPYLLADFTELRHLHERTAYPRLLLALRDPVDRAYAAWSRARAAGAEPIADFAEALEAEAVRTRAGCDWAWRYAELGHYGGQVQRLYTLYSPSQVLIIQHGALVANPGAVLAQALAFIGAGARRTVAWPARPEHDDPCAEAAPDGAPGTLRAVAVEFFRDDIRLLESVTRASFADWLDPLGAPLPTATPPVRS